MTMISVGIPTYNEEKCIAKAINSVLTQISEEDEVIVVASGCTDNTIGEVSKIMEVDDRVRLVVQKERKGKASAINLIINKSLGDIIVQTDGDVELDPDSIAKLLEPFNDPEVGGVSGCPTPLIPEDNMFFDWTYMSYEKMHEIRLKEQEAGTFWHMSGYLLAFRKEALKEVPFAKGAIDAWMGKGIKDAGWKIAYAPDAFVYVKAPLTIKDFIAQKARVRAGYALLPKAPRTVQSEIWSFPGELLKINILRWPDFIFSAFIYAWCWIKGNSIKNKSLEQIWKVPNSTK